MLPNNYVGILTLTVMNYLILSTLLYKKANFSKLGQISSITGHLATLIILHTMLTVFSLYVEVQGTFLFTLI